MIRMKIIVAVIIAAIVVFRMIGYCAAPTAGDIGTIKAVDKAGTVTFVPWGKTETNAASTDGNTAFTLNGKAAKLIDLKEGMWIRFDEIGKSGVAGRVKAGQFLAEDADKVIIFRGLPKEFLIGDVKDWYTNEAGGIQFKINIMRDKEKQVNGLNLRPAKYKEPAGGFVFYWPADLKGAVFGVHGAKPGTTVPDADGKFAITKETVADSYWKHPKNPSKPDLGDVSGLTELTVRKIPKPMP